MALPDRAGLRAVAARSPDEAVTVGSVLREHSLYFQPVALALSGGIWVPEAIPGLEGRSAQLAGAALAADGTVWACGAIVSISGDPSSGTPLVCRRAAGAWEPIDLSGAGNTAGMALAGIACTGRGESFELRAVGTAASQQGVCLRLHGGAWTRMELPPPAPAATSWGLAAVGCSPWGTWYAAGSNTGTVGGAVLVDDGTGWRALPGPPEPELQFTALAFDARGDPWFAANVVGDVANGVLYAYRGGHFEVVSIDRQSAGPVQLFAIGFDAQGYGWVGGGRLPDDPFLAGNSGGATWKEVQLDADAGEQGGTGEGAGEGGQVMGIAVLSKQDAIAVGQVEETGPEGYLEQLPRVFRLVPRPAADPDAPATP